MNPFPGSMMLDQTSQDRSGFSENGVGGINPNQMAFLRAQAQAQGMSMQQGAALSVAMFPQQQGVINSDQQGMNISSEIKRLQQLHQLSGSQGNALLMPGGQRAGDSTLFQSMLDQQKLQAPFFENPLAQSMGVQNSSAMLPNSLLQDARFLMAQNQLNAAMSQQFRPEIPLPSPHSLFNRDGSRRMRGGVIEPFPEKLHRLLLEVEAAGRSDVISFVASGRAFAIHKPDKFFKEIVPLYFRQSRLSSFKRQLNLYGFELINTGPARGGYFHELFVKDRSELCRRMRRVAVKVSTKNEKGDEITELGDGERRERAVDSAKHNQEQA